MTKGEGEASALHTIGREALSVCGQVGLTLEEGVDGRDGQRAGEEVSLESVAAGFFEESALLDGFYAFGEDVEAEGIGEGDDGACDGFVVGVSEQIADKGTVDLQLIEGHELEVAEGGIAGAEVVEGKGDAVPL